MTRTDQEGLQIRENDQSATSPDRDGVNASPNSSVVHDESSQDQQAPQGKQDDREREVADEVSDRGRHFVNASLNSEDVPTRNCSSAAHCSPVTLVIRIVPRQAPATSASVRGVGDNGASLLHAAKNVHSVINAVSRTVAKAVIFNS